MRPAGEEDLHRQHPGQIDVARVERLSGDLAPRIDPLQRSSDSRHTATSSVRGGPIPVSRFPSPPPPSPLTAEWRSKTCGGEGVRGLEVGGALLPLPPEETSPPPAGFPGEGWLADAGGGVRGGGLIPMAIRSP